MRLREILRNISKIPEIHLKLGSHYLVVLNQGKKLECFLYRWQDYKYGGEPIREVTKRFEELPRFLDELKEELGVARTRVVRIWWM